MLWQRFRSDRRKSDRAATVVAAVALAAAGGWRLSLPRPADATAYHARVRAAAAAVPTTDGDWVGTDVPLPAEATDQLRPNVAVSRRYVNRTTGQAVTVLLVQCGDVRDIAAHYPPACYPGQGLTLAGRAAVTLDGTGPGGRAVAATRYTFDGDDLRRGGRTRVDNFVILPDGRTQPDMAGLERRIGSGLRYFGAAQVQVVYRSDPGPAEQTATTERVLRAYRPVLDAIGTGAH